LAIKPEISVGDPGKEGLPATFCKKNSKIGLIF